MGKIDFSKPSKRKKDEDAEINEDLYDMMLSQIDAVVDDEDDGEEEEENEFEGYSEIKATDLGFKLTKRLRDELSKTESKRDYLVFKYRGETLKGVPMAELNPGKFVFNVDGKLKGINLAEAVIL